MLRFVTLCSVAAAAQAVCAGTQKFDDETGIPCPQKMTGDNSEPSLTTKDGNVIVIAKKFGVETPTGVSYFPESMDVALDSLSNTVTSDLAANNLKQDIAMNSTIGRLVRTERELGLGEGSTVTQGGLGALLGGLLEAQQKTMDGDATSIAAILAEEKLQTGLLEKLGKSMDALAAASPGASWVAMSGALGGKLWQTFASGEEVRVAGRDFLPGIPGLYSCKFTNEKQSKSIEGFGQALNANVIACMVPKWTGSMAGTPPHVKTKMEIYEDGVLLKYAGKDADEVIHTDPPPEILKITELPNCVSVGTSDACLFKNTGLTKSFNFVVFDGDTSSLKFEATSSDESITKTSDITFGGSAGSRVMNIKFTTKKGTVKVGFRAEDKYGSKSEVVTVIINNTPFTAVSPEKLACYWSFDEKSDPSKADFAKGGNTIKASSKPNFNPNSMGRGGNNMCPKENGFAAYFNNQDNMRYDFGNKNERCYLEKEFTISLWMKTNTCVNNQIPLILGNDDQMKAGTFIDHHAGFRFCMEPWGCYFYTGGGNCGGWNGQWHHWVITSDGSKHVGYHNGQVAHTSGTWHNMKSVNAYISYMGTQPNWGTNGLGGYLDEVAVWDRGLSGDEVSKLYKMNKDGTSYKINI